MRIDGRQWNEMRPVTITPGFVEYAEGSVLIDAGKTRVLCIGHLLALQRQVLAAITEVGG